MDAKLYHANLLERIEVSEGCLNDVRRQAAAILLCEKNIFSFFKYWLFTYDPRKDPKDIPFVPYNYQEPTITEINQNIIDGVDELTEKSRDMGVTWMILAVFVYRWLFFNESFLVGSRTEDKVDTIGNMDSHFERMRYILEKLPDWLVQACGWDRRNSGYMKIYKANGASITGEAMSTKFSRQGRYKAILLDEFAFVEGAELIWRSCGDSSPCKFIVSTPNGKNNHFAKLRDSGKIKVRTLHWSVHPDKDENWYKEQKAKRTDKDVAQELDINYSVSAGSPFYKGFLRPLHLRKMNINPNRDLILGWDYGFHHPNCSVHQISAEGIWIIVDNIFGEDIIIDEFAEIVKEYLNETYSGFRFQEAGFGDPAGLHPSDKSKKSSVQILREHGFPVKCLPSNRPQTNYTARKNIIEKKLKTLISGIPALVINDVPNNAIFAEGFEGGYHFPKANTVGLVQEVPERDGYYEHPFNSMEYVAVNLFRAVELSDRLPERRHRTFQSRRPQVANAGFGYAKV